MESGLINCDAAVRNEVMCRIDAFSKMGDSPCARERMRHLVNDAIEGCYIYANKYLDNPMTQPFCDIDLEIVSSEADLRIVSVRATTCWIMGPVSREQFLYAIDGMIGQSVEYIFEPLKGVYLMFFATGHEAVDHSCSLCSLVRACEEVVFAAQR